MTCPYGRAFVGDESGSMQEEVSLEWVAIIEDYSTYTVIFHRYPGKNIIDSL